MRRLQVTNGDMVLNGKGIGNAPKLGRLFARSRDFDTMSASAKFVQCTDGELQDRKEVAHNIALHEVDVINSRQQGFLALFTGDTGEVRPEAREQVDAKFAKWRDGGKAESVPGALFIDEIRMSDMQSCSFLDRFLESDVASIAVVAANCGNANIRGTIVKRVH